MFYQVKRLLAVVFIGLLAGACAEPGFNQGSNTECAGFFCVTSTNTASGPSYDSAAAHFPGRLCGFGSTNGIPKGAWCDPTTGRPFIMWESDNPSGRYAGRSVWRRWLDTNEVEYKLIPGTSYTVDPASVHWYHAPKKLF